MSDPYLPPGCTQREIDAYFEQEEDDSDWGAPDECDHEDFDSDWEGRATCLRCGHTWWRSADELAADAQRADDYDRYIRREMRREWWLGLIRPIAFWRRWRKSAALDDEIPF